MLAAQTRIVYVAHLSALSDVNWPAPRSMQEIVLLTSAKGYIHICEQPAHIIHLHKYTYFELILSSSASLGLVHRMKYYTFTENQ